MNDQHIITVIYLNVGDTAKLVDVMSKNSPFPVVKVHEQNDGLVAFVFDGFESNDPEGYFTSFAEYFGFPETEVRVSLGNIFE